MTPFLDCHAGSMDNIVDIMTALTAIAAEAIAAQQPC
jgi:hypothetical protein